ncbi:carboxypeptidase-like regulatory domain-containing protein [Phocaeicola vulgatus]|nr:carboxypeptidase-like regulatory domain-containing protein [Phocaeicola vulgatus]
MLKRLKSVSMLLFLMGAPTGAAYAVANPGVTDVKITQQTVGHVRVSSRMLRRRRVIGASVVVKGTTNGTITGLDGDFLKCNVKEGGYRLLSLFACWLC